MGRRQREWKCLVLAGSLLGFLGQMGSSARASHFQEPSPSLSFRTGRSLTTFPFLSFQILLTLFLSSQTDGSVPNTLVKPRVAAEVTTSLTVIMFLIYLVMVFYCSFFSIKSMSLLQNRKREISFHHLPRFNPKSLVTIREKCTTTS